MKMRKKPSLKLKLNIKLAENYSEFNSDQEGALTTMAESYEKQSSSTQPKTGLFNFEEDAFSFGSDEFLACWETNNITLIHNNLYIGNAIAANDQELLLKHKITHVIDLIAHRKLDKFPEITYLNLSLKDTPEGDVLTPLPDVNMFVETAIRDTPNARVCFWWHKGLSRSVTFLAAHLISKGYTMNEALALIQKQKPWIDPNIGFLGQLQKLEENMRKSPVMSTESFDLYEFSNSLKEIGDKAKHKNYPELEVETMLESSTD